VKVNEPQSGGEAVEGHGGLIKVNAFVDLVSTIVKNDMVYNTQYTTQL
jgi:hypothetical protein